MRQLVAIAFTYTLFKNAKSIKIPPDRDRAHSVFVVFFYEHLPKSPYSYNGIAYSPRVW